jgi:HD-GYP domain-containing protein (c-di-GMP phosphodiesterase class II)
MYDIQHAIGVSQLSRKIGVIMGMDEKYLDILYAAGLYHDIGKILMPKEIIERPDSLTPEEYNLVKWHTTFGHMILSQTQSEIHISAANVALYHHEHIDGTGYLGLFGESIPLAARIVSVADVYNALTADRPYRKKLREDYAMEYLERNAGSWFDEEIVEAFKWAVALSY